MQRWVGASYFYCYIYDLGGGNKKKKSTISYVSLLIIMSIAILTLVTFLDNSTHSE